MSSLTANTLKAMAVFSGVKVATLFCGVIRSKFVALWIGTVGIGLFGIYSSALDMLSIFCMLGIGGAVVRDIAAARTDSAQSDMLVSVVLRWGWGLSLIGGALTMALSPLLSRLSFGGNPSNWWGFILLGGAVAATGLNSMYQAVLQGKRQLKPLAHASLWGVLVGLVVSLPLFWYYGQRGIPFSILAVAVAGCVATSVYVKRPSGPKPSWRQTWCMGRSFVVLGVMMMLSAVASYGSAYAFMAWLNASGGEHVVGLFQAGQTIFNRYAGLIFMAISVEFFPRLASVSRSRRRTTLFCAHELRLLLLMMLPAGVALCACVPLLVRLLYSSEFMSIVPMVTVAAPGLVLRAVGWVLAFPIVARGDGKVLILTESVSALLYFLLNMAGWHIGGLVGLGVSYVVWYLLYSLIVGFVYRRLYGLTMPPAILALAIATFLTVGGACALSLTGMIGCWVSAACALLLLLLAWWALKSNRKSKKQ